MARPSRGWVWIGAVLAVATFFVVVAPLEGPTRTVTQAGPGATVQQGRFQAVIRRTGFGVPHIVAPDLPGAAFGQGWAYAEDRFCDLADQVLKVRSQRSRWLGPGPGDVHLMSDLSYAALGLMDRASDQQRRLPAKILSALEGYVAGFNGYLAAVGASGITGWCAGAPWISPIDTVSLLAYQRAVAISASGAAFLPAIARAQPPGPASEPPAGTAGARRQGRADPTLGVGASRIMGSNAWAIGADRAAGGRGMLAANPHWPWQGGYRFWEAHLTVPGTLNVYGAGLGGIPGVQIGFTDRVAWSHTVSAGDRYTLYSLQLVPGDPTSYVVDGSPERMTARTVSVPVLQKDGSVRTVRRILWASRFGPILDLAGLDPALGWSAERATSYRDANIDNDRIGEFWLDMDQATGLNDIKQAHLRHGTPWLNTVAVDSDGNAWYANASATPNLTPEALQTWLDSPIGLLDGADPRHAWVTEPGAPRDGLLPVDRQPQLDRRDYVFNANNSHWVANAQVRLSGFSPLLGEEKVPLQPRTRLNAILLDGDSFGADRRADLDELSSAMSSNRTLTSDLLAGELIAACRRNGATPVTVSDGSPIDLTKACDVLEEWDRQVDTDSRGAVLWREMVRSVVDTAPDALVSAGPLFQADFNVDDPIGTPKGLAAGATAALRGLAEAVHRLDRAGLPLDVPLGQVQYTTKGSERIPVPGGSEEMGAVNVVGYTLPSANSLEPPLDRQKPLEEGSDLTIEGYPVNSGTSFLMTVELTGSAPSARCLLTTSQDADPASANFADQTWLFTRGQWRTCKFTEQQIQSDPELRTSSVGVDADGEVRWLRGY